MLAEVVAFVQAKHERAVCVELLRARQLWPDLTAPPLPSAEWVPMASMPWGRNGRSKLKAWQPALHPHCALLAEAAGNSTTPKRFPSCSDSFLHPGPKHTTFWEYAVQQEVPMMWCQRNNITGGHFVECWCCLNHASNINPREKAKHMSW